LPEQLGSVIHRKRNKDNIFQTLQPSTCTLQHQTTLLVFQMVSRIMNFTLLM